jgi:lipid A ethanolaminephosphotransferase
MPVSPLTAGMRPKRDFDLPLPASPGIEHIIVIMDESVRGDYFTINDSALATTPYLASDPDVINFGVAVSGANCSVFSRMMLRFGMSENAPSNWRAAINQPTMWEYAKRAGYDTAFINSFDIPRQNWYSYSPAERRLIDKTENMLDVQLYMRDFHIADIVTRLVNEANGRKMFLYVDKFGVHVPYDNKFPPDRIRFAAAANSNIDKTIAEYKNAISWSVDHFFERLKGRIDLSKTLIIYTSDHGQSLYDGGYKQAHCTFGDKVVEGEGKVPLFAMSHVEPFARSLRKAAAADFSRFSHFDVFPTMLEAMGYDRTWIAGKYRSSMLFGSHAEPRGFYYGKPEDNNRRMSSDDKSARR